MWASRLIGRTATVGAVAALLTVAPLTPGAGAASDPATPRRSLAGDTRTHDPSLVDTGSGHGGARWYLFSTGDPQVAGGSVQIRSSRDGRSWTTRGTVAPGTPQWAQEAVPGTTNMWAPDVSRHGGRWYLYYAVSTFGSNRSVIGLYTNTTLDPADADYQWVDQGLVTESSRDDDFNAIDPAAVTDSGGRSWLTFGSFWSGIKMIPIRFPAGKPDSSHPENIGLVDRGFPPDAVEAPYIVTHGNWYYLFASFDFCCQGVNSTYRVVVGRSRSVTGPYVDRAGRSMASGGGSPFLDARGDMRGPGGQSISGETFAFHYYDAASRGDFSLGLARLDWHDGWPALVDLRIRRITEGES